MWPHLMTSSSGEAARTVFLNICTSSLRQPSNAATYASGLSAGTPFFIWTRGLLFFISSRGCHWFASAAYARPCGRMLRATHQHLAFECKLVRAGIVPYYYSFIASKRWQSQWHLSWGTAGQASSGTLPAG